MAWTTKRWWASVSVSCLVAVTACGGAGGPGVDAAHVDAARADVTTDASSDLKDGAADDGDGATPVADVRGDQAAADAPGAPDGGGDVPGADAADADAADAADAASADAVDAAATDRADGAVDAAADGSRDGEGAADAAVSRKRALSLVVYNAPWKGTQRVGGMSVDGQGRVFLEDKSNVFMIEGQTVSTYLTLAEALAKVPVTPDRIADLELGPDGLLYVLAWGHPATSFFNDTMIVRSSAAHAADPWITISKTAEDRMSVFAAGKVGLAGQSGLRLFTANDAGQVVYPRNVFPSGGQCACEDLVAAPSGVFFYEPGCNVAPVYRGSIDGSGFGVLYTGEMFKKPGDQYTPNFLCAARDPAGGFYFMVEGTGGGPFLYHVTETASGTTGLTLVETEPTFAFASKTQSETFAFRYCSLAAGPDGTVFFQTIAQLWKISH